MNINNIKQKKILEGIVEKKSGLKTYKVKMIVLKHIENKYDYTYRQNKRVLVHDENDSLTIGEKILFIFSGRKISKNKHYIFFKKKSN